MIHSHLAGRKRRSLGFTLVELAIVLAVSGVMFAGLYRLLAGGNSQVRDSSAASQQVQLITSVKSFLGSDAGQQWMGTAARTATGIPAGTAITTATPLNLPLPTFTEDGGANVGCKATLPAAAATFCDALPVGLINTTANAYGQTYLIQVQAGPLTATATVPSSYSFMIMTQGGDTITDADGGRISSLIGADGGFMYGSASTSCGAVGQWACGSFGGWQLDVGAYGLAAAAANIGHIVSRTSSSSEFGTTPWLARQHLSGDNPPAPTSPIYNTMTTDLFVGGNNLWMMGNNTPGAPAVLPAVGTNTINLQGGFIELGNGKIEDLANNVGQSLNLQASTTLSGAANPYVQLYSKCTMDASLAGINGLIHLGADSPYDASGGGSPNQCLEAMRVIGDVNVIGMLQSLSLYSKTFIYQSSDERLKTNIQPITNALDAVEKMKPVSFNLKLNGQKSLGVIAQDMEKIYPELVTQSSGKGMKAVNYNGLVAPLIGAVQELKHQNDELRQMIKDQAVRQDELEKALKAKP